MDTDEGANAQTPGQWAVRWHGVVFAAALVLSVPAVHLTWHVLLGHEAPPIGTRSQVPMPVPDIATVSDGSWMTSMEVHLREASPVVWRLRGGWNETLLRCGFVQSARVHLGRDDWMFQRSTLHPDVRKFNAEGADRRRVFARVRDLVRASGAELVISLVPDKARVYPDFAFENGVIDPGKQPLYGRVLQELRDEGITAVDVAATLAAARAAAPDQLFYYRRDTHWRPEGALVAAQTIAAVIESLPVAARLRPRRPTELGARSSVSALGDLVPMLGLLAFEEPVVEGRTRTLPLSLLTANLAETRDSYSVVMREGGVSIPPLVESLDCEILLLGTSFTEADGAGALALALGRPVRAVVKFGASGLGSVYEVLDELRNGTKARVVVWEIVERGLLEKGWSEARF